MRCDICNSDIRVKFSPLHNEYICADCSKGIDENLRHWDHYDEDNNLRKFDDKEITEWLFKPTRRQLRFSSR